METKMRENRTIYTNRLLQNDYSALVNDLDNFQYRLKRLNRLLMTEVPTSLSNVTEEEIKNMIIHMCQLAGVAILYDIKLRHKRTKTKE